MEAGYREWLEQGGAVTEVGRKARLEAVEVMEHHLGALGLPYGSLKEAWEVDKFERLYERLGEVFAESGNGKRQDDRFLLPGADEMYSLANWFTRLDSYGQFLVDVSLKRITSGKKRITSEKKANQRYVLEAFFEPGRENGKTEIDVPMEDVLNDPESKLIRNQYGRMTFILAIHDDNFIRYAQVTKPKHRGRRNSYSAIYTFALQFRHVSQIAAPNVVHHRTSVSSNIIENQENSMIDSSVNLILYGPPGTGKTFATAAEAVRLCGEVAPEDRAELMAVYQCLVAAGRIEFVTFHQSMSYEEFVEGRQPVTDSENEEDGSSAGFRLETVPGIFRRIAEEAQKSRGPSAEKEAVTVGDCQVFKMSIGEKGSEEEAHFFDEAIAGGYTLFGREDVDWSDEKYQDYSKILETCQSKGLKDGLADKQEKLAGRINAFRNRMETGDFIVVTKGKSVFRAIGKVTGEYEYVPQDDGRMCHRRSVNWLWSDEKGVSVDKIYSRAISIPAIYGLNKSYLNIPVLERYMNSASAEEAAAPEPFVLIIDEINRANISRVFGELITLLEPDKRLGQQNELKVRLPYSGEEFGVPANLHIVGTMNTADRSIALLDTALRRRFTFQEVMPEPSVLEEAAGECGVDLPKLLSRINERIEYLYDREHQIGHGYFTGCASREDVDKVMREKVIPLLAEYFFEDWARIAAVLGDLEEHDGDIKGAFLEREVLHAPPGLGDGDAGERFRWKVRDDDFDYEKLTGA